MPTVPTTLIAANPDVNHGRLEVLFIDPGVAGWAALAQGVRPGVAVVLLDAHQDGLSQMVQWAHGQADVAAMHVLSHGGAAQLSLGNLTLNAQNLEGRSADLAALGAALGEEGDVLLYGCDVASDEAGARFVAQWAALTGADVAASVDATGAAFLGGDWVLESETGDVTSDSPFEPLAQASYGGLLGVSDLDFDGVGDLSGTASSVNIDGWTFTVSGGDTRYNTYEGGTKPLYLSTTIADRVFVWDYAFIYLRTEFAFKSTDFSNFDLNSFSLGSLGATSLDVVAYRDGVSVLSEPVDLNFSDSSGHIFYNKSGDGYGSLSLGSAFDNVDEIRLVFNGDASVEIDDIDVSPAIVPPTITSVSVPANGTYGANVNLDFTVNFDQNVTVNTSAGTPRMGLTLGSTTVYASYTTGSGTSAIVFRYTTQPGDLDVNGITVGTLQTNGGTIRSGAGSDANLSLNSVASTANVLVSAVPTITSASYDASTGVLSVTGADMYAGALIDVSKLSIQGHGGQGYTLTSSNITASSATAFTLTLNGTDKIHVNGLLNNNGTSAVDATTFNLAAAASWTSGASADLTGNAVTVSNVMAPTITSATYDASTGTLTVTGTNLVKDFGAANDIIANKFTITGEGGATYTLTDTPNAEISSATQFSLAVSGTNQAGIQALLNKNDTSSTGGTTFNLAAADDWNTVIANTNIADTTNGITVSNVPVPTIISATYNASTGALVLTGTGFLRLAGASNDLVANKFSFTAEGWGSYTLTDTPNVDITSGTSATLTLSASDKAALNQIANKNGTSSTGGTTYNLAAAEDWAAGAAAAVVVADLTGNTVTVSNVAVPSITIASYDVASGVLSVTGSGLLKASGSNNDIDASQFTLTGEGGSTYRLTDTSDVDIDSGTGFSLTLSSTDQLGVNTILNKNGTSSSSGSTYNLAAAENWALGADAAVTVADLSGNAITVSNAPPSTTVASAQLSDDSGDSPSDFITRVAAQTLSGTLSANLMAGESVQVSLDNGASWAAAASTVGSTAWSFATTLSGSNVLKVRVENSAGASPAYAQAYTLDTVDPSPPSNLDLDAATDQGVSSSDDITRDNTPILNGTAESGSTVTVYSSDGTTVLGTATATGGNWSMTLSALGDGDHTVTAKSTDLAGNVSSASSGLIVTIDTGVPSVTHVDVPVQGIYAAGSALNFTVNLFETVDVDTAGGTPRLALNLDTGGTVYAPYVSGSGSMALTFRYTIANGDADATGVTVGALSANGGALMDRAGNVANLTLNSVGSTANVRVDGVAPVVAGVAVPANGLYVAGQTLDFVLQFSENVAVDTTDGIPSLTLGVGTSTVPASYVSGSGSSSLLFRHTIATGSNDSNGITLGTLSLNGGTLRDAAGNGADLTLNSVPSTAGVLVDNTAPTVMAVSVPAHGTYLEGQDLDFTVNLNEVVLVNTAGGTPRIALMVGSQTVDAHYLSGSGTTALTFRSTVASGQLDADGVTLGALDLNGGTIRDAANNPIDGLLNNVADTTGVRVDAVRPTVTGVDSSATNGTYTTGDILGIALTFSEIVTVTGTPQLTLETGGTDRVVDYTSGSGTQTLTFNYTVQAGDTASDLDYISSTALALHAGTIRDSAGNPAVLDLATPGAALSLGSAKNLVVDTTAPAVLNVAVPPNGTYRPDDELDFTVQFSESVNVTGTPVLNLTLDTGGTVQATYTTGSGSDTLAFRYTVVAGHLDADGIAVGTLDLQGGALRDAAGQDAVLTLNNVASTSGVRIDHAIAPPQWDDNSNSVISMTTVQGNGYTLETLITHRPGGGTNTTQTVDAVTVPVADIPLGGASSAPLLQVQLPTGIGLQAFGSTDLARGTGHETLLLQDVQQISNSLHPLSSASIQAQAFDFLNFLSPPTPIFFQTLTLSPSFISPPTITIDMRPLSPVELGGPAVALVIDTRDLGGTSTQILLNNVDFAVVVGQAQVRGGDGANWVVGDSASQFILLGPGDDVLHGGGGNDMVGSTTGRDRLYGDEGDDRLVGGRDGDTLDGGDGNDVIQGGDSDAGTWSFSIVKGELHSLFVYDQPLASQPASVTHVGPWWINDRQDKHHDDRLAFSFESLERLQLVSTLYDTVTGHLPDLHALNTYSTSDLTETQLAQVAVDALLAAVQGLPLQTQIRHVIEQAWGAGPASDALMPEALAYMTQGGHWADGLLALMRSPLVLGSSSTDEGLALSQDWVSSELGWSSASGNDFLHGGAGHDRLVGGDGNDVIQGGEGTDLAAFMGQLNDYVVQFSQLSDGVGVLLRNTFTAEEDYLTGVEWLQLGGRYFQLPDAQAASALPWLQTVPLHEFVTELDRQAIELVGAHLLGSLA